MHYARHRVSGKDYVLRKWRFSHFNENFISRLCGNECFGVWPKHSYRYLFEGGLLCLKNWFI
jgi:hypothetical protein